jgi:branched-subunit amino acid transport protein
MNEILLIAGMTLVTFGIRYPILALLGKLALPDAVFRALRYVPPAVLAAIILPEMIYPGDGMSIQWNNPFLLAGIFTCFVAWRSNNILVTIVCGMLMLWGLKLLFGQL